MQEMAEWDAESLLDYYEFEAELKSIDAIASAAEAHGILCGQIAGGMAEEGALWLRQFLQAIGVKHEPPEACRQWLHAFHDANRNALRSIDMRFTPLLPDDAESLEPRLSGLAEWCSGFLAGFGSTGHRDLSQYQGELKEAFTDLVEISRVDTDAGHDSEDEIDFMELVEYVRIAAVFVYTECALPRDIRAENQTTLH